MVTKISRRVERRSRPPDLRGARFDIEIRIEISAPSGSYTTRSKRLGIDSLVFESGEPVAPGDRVNLLLYLPQGEEELDLVRLQAEVVACTKQQGLFTVAAAFRRYAPGDERRLHDWLLPRAR